MSWGRAIEYVKCVNYLLKCTLIFERSLRESTVRVFGDTAVLMGSVAVEGANAGNMRVTTVFQKRPLGWQMIATHMARAGE